MLLNISGAAQTQSSQYYKWFSPTKFSFPTADLKLLSLLGKRSPWSAVECNAMTQTTRQMLKKATPANERCSNIN